MGLFSGPKTPEPPPEIQKLVDRTMEFAAQTNERAQGQFDWAKQYWDDTQMGVLNDFVDTQLPEMKRMIDLSKQDRTRFQDTFQPLEDSLAQEAAQYSSPAQQELDAGRAIADVGQSFEAERQNALRRLEGIGVDPSQTRNAALDSEVRVQEAAAKAGAANMARERTKQIGRDLRGQAITVGQQYPNLSLTEAQIAAGSGGRAVDAVNQTGAAGVNMQGGAIPWQGAAQNSYTGAGNAVQNKWAARTNVDAMDRASESQQLSTVGTIAGGIVGGMFGGPPGAAVGASAGSKLAEGGEIEGPGGPTEDAIPIRVSDGEYVIPEHVVRKKGTDYFKRMIEKSKEEDDEEENDDRESKSRGGIPAAATGGPVRAYAMGGYVTRDGNYAEGVPAPAMGRPMGPTGRA